MDLADRLELRLLDSERIFLKRLTSFIVWVARYNAPLTENVFKDFEGEHKITYPHDFDYVEKLIENLQRQSGYSEENGWPYKSYKTQPVGKYSAVAGVDCNEPNDSGLCR
ncbi:hypothetical protein [Prosthecochloris sp. ZM]|uniref:hypothetical protein n=1 Tax=Prosthecochloris sp. ZM TaxID=2283143 RepID=UPI0011C05CC6|nr:hypothetical protein [Prosthecochloris sp. ZM]